MRRLKVMYHKWGACCTRRGIKTVIIAGVYLIIGYYFSSLIDLKLSRVGEKQANKTHYKAKMFLDAFQTTNNSIKKVIVSSVLLEGNYKTVRPFLDESLGKNINSRLKQVEISDAVYNEVKNKHCFYSAWTNTAEKKTKDVDSVQGSKRTENSNKFECNKFISLTYAMGRTGNQMFQTASLLGIAYRYNLVPVLPTAIKLSQYFDLPNLKDVHDVGALTNAQKFSVAKCGVYDTRVEKLNITANLTIDGYFQSWKYFENAAHLIKSAFTIKSKYLEKAEQFLNSSSQAGYDNVCIHVRRGDMIATSSLRKGYSVADLHFLNNSMNFYRKNLTKVQFIIVSDGMSWCKQHITGNDVIYSPFLDLASDMALMTLCDHVIVTSGTFGWWGAWLSGGTTVYFAGFPGKGSWLSRAMNVTDYYPRDWIGM